MTKDQRQGFSFSENFALAEYAFLSPWDSLRGARVFLTGGTGFFGCWLLQFFQWANEKQKLNLRVDVLTRNPGAFLEKHPEFKASSFLKLIQGDVRNFAFPRESYSHLIHAATEASQKLNQENPLLMVDTIIEGTRRTLEFAKASGVSRYLLTSSGAVYGKQPSNITHVDESFSGAPNPLLPGSAYGEGKRMAEYLCTAFQQQHGVNSVIARCFAFVGPYLPRKTHFAIGNFIQDSLDTGVIRVRGDGTPFRSYLYGADLAYWLVTLLVHGSPGEAYNVGSERDLNIRTLAETVADTVTEILGKSVQVQISSLVESDPAKEPERYVPSTQKARSELGLRENFDLRKSIQQTVIGSALG